MPRPVSVVRVDDVGIRARSRREAVLDVLVDGRRVFSYWLQRDGVREGTPLAPVWLMPWPKTLREFLDGRAVISVVVHETGDVVYREEVRLGAGGGPIRIVNRRGQPLSLDKSMRRVVTFDTRSEKNIEPLLDAIGTVLDALREVGIDAFLAYGTMLGAVREGRLLGHDSDADLGYVSRYSHPVDVIRESFRIQRAMIGLGLRITRYSALAFKVDVIEADGVVRGLDVFGGFLMDGHLHLMGEIREPYAGSWPVPLTTATLEGREFPVPEDSDWFLTASYGPSWRVPDPAFHFSTPSSTYRRFNGWFRGLRVGRAKWDRIYSRAQKPLTDEPSPLVAWAAEREPDAATYVDIGCGRGTDVLWMAARGVPSVGLDFQPRSFRDAADRDVAGADFWTCNLLELRDVLPTGATLARRPGPRLLVARHLVDTLGPDGRDRLWRLARMTLAGEGGGRLYLDFVAKFGDDGYARDLHVTRRRPGRLVPEIQRAGGTIVHRDTVKMSGSATPTRVGRLVVEWR